MEQLKTMILTDHFLTSFITDLFLILLLYDDDEMGYLPQHSLENLKKYSYKGVDKYVSSIFRRKFR